MINLIILVILAASAALMYLKGTLIQAVAMILNVILAGFVAMAFHEMLAVFLVKYAAGIALWSPLICFLLLFIVTFALLQTVAMQTCKEKTDLGLWPERIGRIGGGLLLGYLIVGQLLVAVALAPLPIAYPYPRFAERNPNPTQPNKPLLSPDGFVSGLFSLVSQGSLSAMSQPKSFGMLHAGFLDSLYLNRENLSKGVSAMTKEPAIEVPRKGGVWEAPPTLRDEEGQSPTVPSDARLMIVRMGIRRAALADASKFTLSQCRLICGMRGETDPLAGKGHVVYPIGYLDSNGRLVRKSLDEEIVIQPNQVRASTKDFDLAFAVPTELVPILLGFKRNNLERLSEPVSGDEIPAATSDEETPPPTAPAQQQPPSEQPNQTPPTSQAQPENQGNGLSSVSQTVIGGALEDDVNP
jgi:hypothetical protein